MLRGRVGEARPVERGARCCAPRRARRVEALRGPGAGRAHRRATAACSCAQASSSGLAGRVAFCAAASCAAVSGPVDDVQVVRGPLAQLGGAPRPRGDGSRSHAGELGHPGRWIDRRPLEAHRLVQFAAQGGLIDHPGGFGFVIQRRAVDRHQLAVGAGLAVGHDHVGVQVRVPAPRRLVLIGDRHQPRQALQVLLAGERVVHPGVAGVGGQVLHRLGQRGGVRVGDRLGDHIIGRSARTQRDALGCAERQIESVHTALTERASVRTVGAMPSSSQRATTSASASPPARWASVKPTNARRGAGVAGAAATPGCGFRVRSSTPPARRRRAPDPWRPAAALGGVDVVVDRPPLELRDRQHPTTYRLEPERLAHSACGSTRQCAATKSRTPCANVP